MQMTETTDRQSEGTLARLQIRMHDPFIRRMAVDTTTVFTS